MEVARAGDTDAMAVILDVRYNRSITTTQIGICWLWCINEDLAPAVEFFFQRRLVPDIDALSLRNEQISVLANEIQMNSLGGDSPFLYAVRQNSYAAARVLLAHGANVNYRNEQGTTALLYMVGRWRDSRILEFIRYLRQRGADATVPNNNGLTALQFAENILLGAQAHNEAANIIALITAVRNAL
jgi:ankyrin repeat protein